MGQCKNCAWYCHADGMCYGTKECMNSFARPLKVPNANAHACGFWQFDGLEDWERAEYEKTGNRQ